MAEPSRKQPISLVIPVYNEVENLRDLQAAVTGALDPHGIDFECILVNDGSTDGSTQLLDEIHREDPRFVVIHFIRNFGQVLLKFTARTFPGVGLPSHTILTGVNSYESLVPAWGKTTKVLQMYLL